MSEPKVAREVAELDVDVMLGALGVSDPEPVSRAAVIAAYMEGRVTFDPVAEEGTYTLGRPISLENGSRLESVKFHEPDGAELQYITAQPSEINPSAKTFSADFTQGSGALRKGIRYLIKVCKVPLGVAERVKARDQNVMAAIAGFFS